MDYNEACRQATTDQGLDPITEALRAAGIPHGVDQTGGFTMCVNVPLNEAGTHYLYVTAGEFYDGSAPDTAAVGEYWICDALYGLPDSEYHSEGLGEIQPEGYRYVYPISEIHDVVREAARAQRGCPWHDPRLAA